MIKMLYEPFRHWSEGGSVWMIGDTHFGDKDCKLMDRDWITPEEQVDRINKYAKRPDTLIILGDVGDPEYVKDLKAHYKVLIAGNHDACSRYEDLFNEIYKGPLFIAPKILLSHEPVDVPFALNIHGHCHDGSSFLNGINMAANMCDYTPVSLSVLIKSGALSGIKDIHRLAIEYQIKHPLVRNEK